MFKLILCEWLRIKKVVFIAVLIHFFVLAFLIQFGLFINYTIGLKMSMAILYGGCGYLLGMTQLKKYTQNNHWAYFVNRPIEVKKVYLALLLTTIMAIVIVIIMPYLLVTLALDYWNIQIIDLRHYQQLLYLFGITLSFYLLSCFTVLIKRKSAHLLIMFTILPLISLNVGGSVYWLLLGVVVYLFLMVISAVKVNLNNLPNGLLFQTLTAGAFQYALYFIIVSLFFMINEVSLDIGYKTGEMTKDKSLDSNSFRELIFLNPQDALITSLHTQDNQYGDLIEEIKLSETTRIRKRVWFHPTKQQLPYIDENETAIADVDNNINWQFSHDSMLFVGKDISTKKIVGYLGPNQLFNQLEKASQNDIFPVVPWVQDDQIVVKNKVYQYQNNQKSFRLLFAGNDGEFLLNGLQHLGSVQAVVSTKHLYLFDSIDYHNDKVPLQTQIIIPLPGDYNNLWDIQITEVIDRFILTFLYGKSSRHDVYDAVHLSYELTLAGQVKPLNKRLLEQTPILMIKDLDYMISPAWKLALDYFPTHPARDRYLEQRPQVSKLSKNTTISLIILALFYVVITLILAKKRAVSGTKKWAWAIFNSVLGLPGLFSFMLLNPKKLQLMNNNAVGESRHV